MKEKLNKGALIYHYTILTLVFLFLALPIVASFLYSISSSWSVSILPDGFTLKWYANLLDDERFLASLLRSLYICILSLLLCFVLVFPLVLVSNLYLKRLKPFVNFLVLMPFAVPPIVTCVGLLELYSSSLGGSAYILIFAYFTLSLPFVYRALENAISGINLDELIASNAILGGSLLGAVFKLIIPSIKNGLLVAFFLSFSFLIGEFLYANILVGGAYETLQVYLYTIKNQSGHYSSALLMVYFLLIFIATFLASLLKDK